jgi:NAD(P)-dependent dehydrogenase (short-subunit alcohol dehydrogenase family)
MQGAPNGHIALVNGAAGGIGKATVAAFLADGWHVIGIDHQPAVESAADGDYRGFRVDIGDSRQLAAVLDEAERTAPPGRRLRAVVGIAGGADAREATAPHFTATPEAAISDVLRSNYTNQHLFAQLVWPWLVRSGPGDRSVTFTGSINASAGYRMPGYAAAKAALVGLMRSLSGTEGLLGIRVNVVSPGAVRTEWWRTQPESSWPLLAAQQRESESELAKAIPLGRVAEPDDVAATYLWVAGHMHLTGEEILLDGGQFRQQTLIDVVDPERSLAKRAAWATERYSTAR